MRRTVILYFLLLALPAAVMPFVAHWILEGELARGRVAGLSYLRAQAELAALKSSAVDSAVETGKAPPSDARCRGMAATADGGKVYAWWKGDTPLGEQRRRRIHRIELSVFAGSLAIFAVGLGLLLKSLAGARAEAERHRRFTADFTHRLKTPLTSISLCAELARSGRLPPERTAESTETIVREAEKLNGIVDEVLGFMEEPRRG